MEVTITLDDSAVQSQLNAAPNQIRRALVAGLNDASALLLEDLKTYPQQRSGTTYRRTNTLKRSWTREIKPEQLAARVGSNANVAPYNRYVQDEAMQARVHHGRWNNTVQATSRNRQQQINDMFAARLRQFIG